MSSVSLTHFGALWFLLAALFSPGFSICPARARSTLTVFPIFLSSSLANNVFSALTVFVVGCADFSQTCRKKEKLSQRRRPQRRKAAASTKSWSFRLLLSCTLARACLDLQSRSS